MLEEGKPKTEIRQTFEEPPPILGTWRRLYVAVLVFLFVVILALFIFTRHFEGVAP
jgi:hypothetical protein